jgi:hypothetical protein
MMTRAGARKKRSPKGTRVRPVAGGLWIEEQVGTEWVAAFRISRQHGRPVVSEVRLLPREGDRAAHLESRSMPGEWSQNDATVPAGGITTNLLRAVKMGNHLADVLTDYFGHAERVTPRETWPAVFQELANRPVPAGRRGRPPMTLAQYAKLADAYVDAVERGCPNPVRVAAELVGWKPGRFSSALFRARKHGLLTRAGVKQGRRGGTLTPKALELLAKSERTDVRKRRTR